MDDSQKCKLIILNIVNSIVDLTKKFQRKVSRLDAYVLIDIVANHCYLNSSCVKCISLNVTKSNCVVMLKYGLEVEFEGTISMHVKI